MVDAEGRNISGDYSSYFKIFVGMKEQLRVARENPSLHAVGGIVHHTQGLVEIFIRLDGDHRAKNLLAVHFHVGLCPGKDSWLDQAVGAAAAAEQPSTGSDGLVDPTGGADRIGLADNRANVGGFVQRITRLQLLHRFDQQVSELSVHRLFYEDALHGDAGLACVGKSADNAAIGSIGHVGIIVHDDCGVAPEFENDFLLSSATLDVPADGNAAGEADEFNAIVSNQDARILVGERDNIQSAVGPPGLLHAFGEKKRAERRLGRRLQDDGASGSNRGSDLVGDQVDGEIKRGDAGDRTDWKTPYDAPASGGVFLPIQGDVLSINAGAFLGRHAKGEDCAFHFGTRGFDGLTGFLGESAGELFLALCHERNDLAKDPLAFEGGQAAGSAKRFHRGCDCRFCISFAALGHASNHACVVRRADVDEIALLLPTAIHKKAMRRNRRDRHLCHDLSEPPDEATSRIIGLLDAAASLKVFKKAQHTPSLGTEAKVSWLTMSRVRMMELSTISELAMRLRKREVSPVEIARGCVGRIERLNPALNAFITVMGDSAVAEARAAEAEIGRGQWRGPLHGIPIALKDLIDTAGVRTTSASALHQSRVPGKDAEVVRRLRTAGAIVIGKNNLHEFAYGGSSLVSYFGEAHNPWDQGHITGGSSGGSAAAVSAGLAYAAIGTDTAGSVREPAALCGCVGLKATYGRVSSRGVIPLSPSLDHVGPLARSVADAAIVLQLIAGLDAADITCADVPLLDYVSGMKEGPQRLRVGIPGEYFFDDLDPEVALAMKHALDGIQTMVAQVKDVRLEVPTDRTLQAAESYAYHAESVAKNTGLYQAETLRRIRSGENISATEYIERRRELEEARRTIRRAFADVDVVVTPTTPMPAPAIAELIAAPDALRPAELRLLRNTRPFNVWGLPAISVPCGFTQSGLPIGLQIAGPHWREDLVLQLAYAYEQATAWHKRGCVLA